MSKFEKEQKYSFPKVLIAGYGIVGRHLKEEFPFAETCDPDVDQKADYVAPPERTYAVAFISVPTPNNEDHTVNLSFVESALRGVSAEVYVIKSTVPPETSDKLAKKYGKKIVFSPEFHGNTAQSEAENNFVILGGDDQSYHKVRQLYELVKPADFKIYHCKNTEAELIKYMENCYLGMKVVFCNQFKDLADLYGVSYDAIRDGVILDKRIGESHTRVFDDYRGYDSKCLNKDIPAIVSEAEARGYDNFIMKFVDRINGELKMR